MAGSKAINDHWLPNRLKNVLWLGGLGTFIRDQGILFVRNNHCSFVKLWLLKNF